MDSHGKVDLSRFNDRRLNVLFTTGPLRGRRLMHYLQVGCHLFYRHFQSQQKLFFLLEINKLVISLIKGSKATSASPGSWVVLSTGPGTETATPGCSWIAPHTSCGTLTGVWNIYMFINSLFSPSTTVDRKLGGHPCEKSSGIKINTIFQALPNLF